MILDRYEEIELIRQSERANLNDSEQECLIKWACTTLIANDLLQMLFNGHVEVQSMIHDEPTFTITPSGEQVMCEMNTDFDEHEIEEYFDESEINEDEEDDDEDEEYLEYKIDTLKALCKKLGIQLEDESDATD